MSELVLSSATRRLQDHAAKDRILAKYEEGETPEAIAEWLQHDLLEFPESTPGDLAKSIRELFVLELPLERRLEIATQNRGALRKSLARQRSTKSTYEMLRDMVLVQERRIELYHEKEIDEIEPKMMGQLAHEIETIRRMLRDLHEMEQELGVRPGQSGAEPSQGLTQDMRMRLGKALKGLIEEADDDVIDVEVVDEQATEN